MTRVSVDFEWYGPEYLERVERGFDRTLALVSADAASVAAKSMPGAGASASASNKNGRLDEFTPSRVGRPPGVRTGLLRNSVKWSKLDRLRYGVGTSLKYGRIHEKGGTFRHPGGTSYFVKSGRAVFVSRQTADRFKAIHNRDLPKTKPHTIVMPKRPYLAPQARRTRKFMKSSGFKRLLSREIAKAAISG